jgi:hypothetical protein
MYNPMTSFYFRQGGRHQSELLDFFTGILHEKLRKDLHSKVKEFLSHTSTHFLPHKKQSDYYDITYRYEAKKGTDHEASRKFKELYTMIDNIGTEIYNLYREMATIAQRNI